MQQEFDEIEEKYEKQNDEIISFQDQINENKIEFEEKMR